MLLAPIIIIGGLVVFEYTREYTYFLLIVIIIRFFPEISVLLKPEDVSILFQLFMLSMCLEYVNNSRISDTQRWKERRWILICMVINMLTVYPLELADVVSVIRLCIIVLRILGIMVGLYHPQNSIWCKYICRVWQIDRVCINKADTTRLMVYVGSLFALNPSFLPLWRCPVHWLLFSIISLGCLIGFYMIWARWNN